MNYNGQMYYDVKRGGTLNAFEYNDNFDYLELSLPPTGSIVAWAKDFTSVPSSLLDGWQKCDGAAISDTSSPMYGQSTDDMTGGEFLYGHGTTSGNTKTSNFLPSHTHLVSASDSLKGYKNHHNYYETITGGAAGSYTGAVGGSTRPKTDGTAWLGHSVVWCLRTGDNDRPTSAPSNGDTTDGTDIDADFDWAFANNIPIGGIIGWAKNISGVPQTLTNAWKVCDGTEIINSNCPMNGENIPNLSNRFLYGTSTSGSTKTEDKIFSHNHSVGTIKFLCLLGYNTGDYWTGGVPECHLDGTSGSATAGTAWEGASLVWIMCLEGNEPYAIADDDKSNSIGYQAMNDLLNNTLPPIGAVIPWTTHITGTPSLPANWQICDGDPINDEYSLLDGQNTPNLVSKFVYGDSTGGNTKTQDYLRSHTHNSGTLKMLIESGGSAGRSVGGAHNGVFSGLMTGNLGSNSALGTAWEGFEVIWIMRIK